MNYKAFKSQNKTTVNHHPFDLFEPFKNDDKIGEQILQAILKKNPHIMCGDRMIGPVMLIKTDGYRPSKEEIDKDAIDSLSLDYKLPQWSTIIASSVRYQLPFNGDVLSLPTDKKFIHYYSCLVFTYTAKIGDLVRVIDPIDFSEHEVPVTDEMIKRGNYAMFRFALS